MVRENKKPSFLKVRLPLVKTGRALQPKKGGKYHRTKEKKKTRQEIEAGQ
jgi:hypothetical protein